MNPVTLYTTMFCPFCHAAKRLLDDKGVAYEEIDVSFSPGDRAAMRERADGRNTVPQIFIGDTHVGGCDELHAMERAGKLDALLEAA